MIRTDAQWREYCDDAHRKLYANSGITMATQYNSHVRMWRFWNEWTWRKAFVPSWIEWRNQQNRIWGWF